MATFEKLRVSLARDDAGPLLDGVAEPVHRSRREFLEAAFAEARAFLHRRTGRRFDFIPLQIDGDYVAGIIKRQAPVPLHDAALRKYEADNHEAAVVILSVAKDQIVWVQNNPRVGATKSILESFFQFIVEKTKIKDWRVHVEYIHDEREYFTVIRERRAEIAKITFTFIPPNALGAEDEVYNFVKTVQAQANPGTQKHLYLGEPGTMNPDTPVMNASARVAMAGGGDAEVRDKANRVLYSSAKARVTRDVPADQLPTPEHAAFVERVRDWLFG